MSIQMQPLFWRLSSNNYSGLDSVSLLMPHAVSEETATEFPTEVRFYSKRNTIQPVDLRWSPDDAELFFLLLERLAQKELDGNVEVDLTDKTVQSIVQLVAQVRFQRPWSMDDLLGEDLNTERQELSIGDRVALNTCYGFPLAVVVGLDSIDVTCVLLNDLAVDEHVLLAQHSLLTVNRMAVLPAVFSPSDVGENYRRH